eukprot:793947-Karenia_brevis.AAC.1
MGPRPATAAHLGSRSWLNCPKPKSSVADRAQLTPPGCASIHPSVGDVGLEGECKAHPPHRP